MLHVLLLAAAVALAGCAPLPAQPPASGTRDVKETQTGLASFYSASFEGEETASGETFSNRELVAAHPTYPPGTILRVTSAESGRAVEVRVVDRGPAEEARREGVIVDLSRAAAEHLGMTSDGRVRVRVEVLAWGEPQAR